MDDSEPSSPRECLSDSEVYDGTFEDDLSMSSVDFSSDFTEGPGRTDIIKAIATRWSKNIVKKAGQRMNKVIKVEDIKKKMKGEPFLRAKDKISFLLGVLMLMFTEWILISYPTYLYLSYTVIIFPLLGWRFLDYHRSKYHYFMLDFCYFANLLTMLWLYVWPHNLKLFKLTFALCTGPLLMAVIAWSNSLVFHDLDRTTSLFIHIYPPLVLYAERWHNPTIFASYPPEMTEWTSISEAIWVPLLFYAAWQAAYLFKTEVMDKKKFAADADMVTSARWLTKNKPHFVYLYLKKKGIDVSPNIILPAFQLCYTLVMLLPTILFFHFRRANQAILFLVFAFACWNGANFYFDIFSEKYRARLQNKVSGNDEEAPSGRLPSSRRSVVKFVVWLGSFIALISFMIHTLC